MSRQSPRNVVRWTTRGRRGIARSQVRNFSGIARMVVTENTVPKSRLGNKELTGNAGQEWLTYWRVSANPTSSETLVAELAVLLAGHPGAHPQQIEASALAERPQKQLLEAARLLGLATVSRLKKDALVQRLWQAWQELLARVSEAPHGAPGDGSGASVHEGNGHKANGATGAAASAPAALTSKEALKKEEDVGEPVAPVAHKFELHPNAVAKEAAPPKDIPWGYGKDRVTAMPVDPERLFVYWEVTEDGLERARRTLGAAAEGAWLNLRIYDTTGRIFDGWNAHATIDQGVDRSARQWFFRIGKPSSEAIVEIGLLARDGGFAKIARSGRVEFPRHDPVAWTEPEWLTVRLADGQVRRGWMPRPAVGQGAGGAPGGGPAAAPGGAPALPVTLPSPDMVVQVEEGERVVHRTEWHSEWEEVKSDGYVTGEGRLSWEEQGQISSWSEGPFPYPVEVPEPVRETSLGRTRVFRSGARTHVVYGPWQVVIHGLGATRSRSVLTRWEVYRSWGEQSGRHIVHVQGGTGEGHGAAAIGASEQLMRGASERVWRGGSELRLGGSSEVFYLGASELRLAGASERMYMGASELVRRGASERRLSGEAQWARQGASEGRLGGEAQWVGGGGSEGRLGGSSDFAPRAPSPSPIGASEYPRPPGRDDAKQNG